MTDLPPSRITWVDAARGIGIFLVVLGHTIRGLVKGEVPPSGWAGLDAWIYAFHMPLFFFLSGLFFESSWRKGTGRFFSAKLRTLAWPYFVWSILQEAIRRASSGGGEFPPLWTIVYKPVMQFWFFYVLFLIAAFYAVWRRLGGRASCFVALAFLLHASLWVGVNYGVWSVLYMVFIYVPYAALGVAIAQTQAVTVPSSRSASTLLAASAAGYIGIVGLVVAKWATLPVVSLAAAVVGIGATVGLASVVARYSWGGFVERLGRCSLEIYVAHSIFSAAARAALLKAHVDAFAVQVFLGVFAGLLGPMMLGAICRRLRLDILFEFPRSRHVPS